MHLKFFEYKKSYKFIIAIIFLFLISIIFPNKILAATNCAGKIIPADGEQQERINLRNECLGPEISEMKEIKKEGSDVTYKIKWNEPSIGKSFVGKLLSGPNLPYEFTEYQIWYVSPSGSGSISVANYDQRELDFKTSAGMGDNTTTTVRIVAMYSKKEIMIGAPPTVKGEGPSKSTSINNLTADAPQLNGSGNYDKNSKKATVRLNWFLRSDSKPDKYNLYKWIGDHKPSQIKNFNSNVLNFEETFSLNLAKGETITYNYSIEAVYLFAGSGQEANSNIVFITFTGGNDGDVSSQTGTGPAPSTPYLHNTDPGILDTPPAKSQCETQCKKRPGWNPIEEWVCTAVCWISTAIMALLNCGFETLKASLVPQDINWSNCLNTTIEGSESGGGGGGGGGGVETTPN